MFAPVRCRTPVRAWETRTRYTALLSAYPDYTGKAKQCYNPQSREPRLIPRGLFMGDLWPKLPQLSTDTSRVATADHRRASQKLELSAD